ncbi:MAG: flagellar export chaperone FlgN [Deltaproteobacteria bacterium]|jgi:hypothetical protein|nr:flagellar export chaperone FlgN [Deltaproteobacteria bacterium]
MDLAIVAKLALALKEHLDRYQKLVDFLSAEKKYLLNLDLDGLLVTSQAKEILGREIQNGIGALINNLSDAALMLGLPNSPSPTLVEVAKLCPKPYANQIIDMALTLTRLKNVILRENEANKRFTQESLALVNGSINALTGADQIKGDSYGQDGSKDQSVKKARPSKVSKEV